jgi:CheY-like chemotaxis protein
MSDARISVVVAEDELLLRMDIVDALQDAGFIVFEAGNAKEAIDVINAHPEIQALFTDIDMPGSMDGLELAALVKDRWPPISVIVTSGHWKVRRELLPQGSLFMPKPYNSIEIVKSIRELISVQ